MGCGVLPQLLTSRVLVLVDSVRSCVEAVYLMQAHNERSRKQKSRALVLWSRDSRWVRDMAPLPPLFVPCSRGRVGAKWFFLRVWLIERKVGDGQNHNRRGAREDIGAVG
jgi:hypothetical protein